MVIRRVRHEVKHIPEHADEFNFEPEHEFWCTTHPQINLLSQIFLGTVLFFFSFFAKFLQFKMKKLLLRPIRNGLPGELGMKCWPQYVSSGSEHRF